MQIKNTLCLHQQSPVAVRGRRAVAPLAKVIYSEIPKMTYSLELEYIYRKEQSTHPQHVW